MVTTPAHIERCTRCNTGAMATSAEEDRFCVNCGNVTAWSARVSSTRGSSMPEMNRAAVVFFNGRPPRKDREPWRWGAERRTAYALILAGGPGRNFCTRTPRYQQLYKVQVEYIYDYRYSARSGMEKGVLTALKGVGFRFPFEEFLNWGFSEIAWARGADKMLARQVGVRWFRQAGRAAIRGVIDAEVSYANMQSM